MNHNYQHLQTCQQALQQSLRHLLILAVVTFASTVAIAVTTILLASLAAVTASSAILAVVTFASVIFAVVTFASTIFAVVTDPFCSIAVVTVLLLGVPILTEAPMVITKMLAPLTGAEPNIISLLQLRSPRWAGWIHC